MAVDGWGLLLRRNSRLDGYTEHLASNWDVSGRAPIQMRALRQAVFPTREQARRYKREAYGYWMRPDLKAAPHGHLPIKIVRVRVTVEALEEQ